MSLCPSPETLGRLAHARSSGSRFAAMEAHVEACPDCQNVLERLAADSSACEDREPEGLPPREQPPMIPGFVIERELGRGGMGVVYQARQPRLARRVAIKVVSGGVGVGAEDRRRWLREAQALGQVRHRNVVQLLDAGEHDGCLYLVLDLVPGGSLAERVSGPMTARVAVELMVTVTRAVAHLHQAGIVHLDVKPSNILLDGPPDGRWDQVTPMITDFGIARTSDDPGATVPTPVGARGTPSYMAPEQIAGDRATIGPQSDVFALGATLYCLLTGRPPFQAASVIETLVLMRTREPAPLRTLVPGLPRDLETIALTCLRKDPRRRYASAEDLADDLKRWLDGFPIQARPVSKLEHAGRWCRRRPALASLLAVLALTVASSLVGLYTLWRQSENALARAIASDKATSATVRELVGLLATTVDAPQMLASERIEKSSRVVRELTAKLRRDRGFAAPYLVAICDLERQLAEDFRRRGKFADSRTLLVDSLGLLEGRRGEADDPDVEVTCALALTELGRVGADQERFDESLACVRRAEEALNGLVHNPRRLEAIISIDRSRRQVAGQLGHRGLEGARRKLLESHIRMLEHMGEDAGRDPVIEFLAALARLDLASNDGAITTLRAAIQRFRADRRLPEQVETKLGVWIGDDVDPYPFGLYPTGKTMDRPDPDAHAVMLIEALESRCKFLGVYPTVLHIASLRIAGNAAITGADLRRAGRLDDARRTAACLSAFAKALIRRDPDEVTFHLLLCEAFEQESKNAWKVEDRPAIEEALRKALGEAHTALRLDSRNATARMKVAGLQDKLAGLAAERPLSR